MPIAEVKAYLARFGRDADVIEFDGSSATVALAAEQLGTKPARIAKTLSFKNGDGCLLVVAAGHMRIDNAKFKAQFGVKASMLSPDEVLRQTGHAVGGVCPFALPEGVPVYIDASLRAFETVYPACGTANSAIEFTPDALFDCAGAIAWVDVCKAPAE